MNKKGQGLPLNTIVIAALVIIVLVFLILIFTGRLGDFGLKLDDTSETCKGTIKYGTDVYTLKEVKAGSCSGTTLREFERPTKEANNVCCGTKQAATNSE